MQLRELTGRITDTPRLRLRTTPDRLFPCRRMPACSRPVLIGGSLILLINFALRASFGVFQIPIAEDFGWPRAEFRLAIAIQNLAWGIGQPIFGALAERWGDRWAIILGALLYAPG